jgi:hypothetical protein
VTKVVRAETSAADTNPKELGHSRWLVNDDPEPFDAIIVTVGTCGAPKRAHFPGMPDSDDSHVRNGTQEGKSYADAIKSDPAGDESSDDGQSEKEKHGESGEEIYEGPIVHSSELDDAELEGKTVVVIGSGASGVEAIETALEKGAKKGVFIARWVSLRSAFRDTLLIMFRAGATNGSSLGKWSHSVSESILSLTSSYSNILIDTTLSAQPFGRQTPLSFIWEKFITYWNYYGVRDLTPANRGIFEGTPIVNDEFLNHVRKGKCEYVRGDTQRLTRDGVLVNVRGRDSKPGDHGEEVRRVIVLLLGISLYSSCRRNSRRTLSFSPQDLRSPRSISFRMTSSLRTMRLIIAWSSSYNSADLITIAARPLPAKFLNWSIILHRSLRCNHADRAYRGLVHIDDQLFVHECDRYVVLICP